jgi:putative inorganic carbon (hco3(-)) transporter
MFNTTLQCLPEENEEPALAQPAVPAFPFRMLCVFLLIVIVRPTDFISVLGSLPLALLAFVGMLAAWFLSGRFTLTLPHATNKFALALLVAMILSTPFSYWRGLSTVVTVEYAKTVAFMIVLVNLVTDWTAITRVLWLLVPAHSLHAAMLVRTYLNGNLTRGRAVGAAGGVFGDPNDLALSFVIMLPITLWLFTYSRHAVARLLCVAMLLLFVAGVIASQSRGGLLGLSVVGVLMIYGSRYRVPMATAAVALGLLIVVAAPPQTWERYSTIKDYDHEESAQNRLYLWQAGLQMWADHPVIGVGPGAFSIAYGLEYLHSTAPTRAWFQAHNAVVQVASELGTLGLIAWAGMIAAGFIALREARHLLMPFVSTDMDALPRIQLGVALRSALVGYLVCALFLSRAYDWLLAILLALDVCYWRIAGAWAAQQADAEAYGEWESDDAAQAWPGPVQLGMHR